MPTQSKGRSLFSTAMKIKQPVVGLVAILFAAIAVAAVAVAGSPPQAIVVTVDTGAEVGSITTHLGTQFVWPGTFEGSAGSRARFNALAPPLVRINATTLGAASVLPAGKRKGDWSFDNLNSIVNDVRAANSDVLLTVAYAPEWMWDCASSDVRDPTFGEFGDYMARLVAYFNRGRFVAEDGRELINPAGVANRIAYWELWNEPDQIKGCPPMGNQITPAEYVAMWNGAVPKMIAVDPTIKIIGPATSQAASARGADYVPALMAGATRKPDAISFHGYGGWLNSQSDRFLFDGQGTGFGLDAVEQGVERVKAWAPNTPVWITELNVDSAWDRDDPAGRPWTGFGAAWGASAFRGLALAGADVILQYQFSHPDLRQFSLVDTHTGLPLLPYWRDFYLGRYFPPGSVLLGSSTNVAGVESLAARVPGSDTVHVLVVNRRAESDIAVGAPGRPAKVRIDVKDPRWIGAVTARVLDSTTPLETGPPAISFPTDEPIFISFPGYGAAFLEFTGRL